nr:hypothetical protein LVJ77_06205 [Conchiformibius kuhniae]
MKKYLTVCALASVWLSACSLLPPYSTPPQNPSARDEVDDRRAADILNSNHARTTVYAPQVRSSRASAKGNGVHPDHMPLVLAAERYAVGKARNVLTQGRVMALFHKEVVRGGCWDYLDTVFTRAGVPRQARKTVYKGHASQRPLCPPRPIARGRLDLPHQPQLQKHPAQWHVYRLGR